MKIKSILTKTAAVAALSVAGITAMNAVQNNDAQAAVVDNDIAVYTVHKSTNVYTDYQKDGKKTGQVLDPNTNWKVIKTAYDANGDKWYDLGKDQWVKAEKPVATTDANASAQSTSQNTESTQVSQAPVSNTAAKSTSTVSGSEAAAKAWIASRESGGSYSASNGQYIGKYQLSASYLNGDYSAANQERVADNYVKSRYGSWTAAQSFWQANGWY